MASNAENVSIWWRHYAFKKAHITVSYISQAYPAGFLIYGFSQSRQQTRVIMSHDQEWGLLSKFPLLCYFPDFSPLLNNTFVLGRYCRSSAAATPVKYESNSNKLTNTFARSKLSLTEKSTNGALVTPTPENYGFPDWLLLTHCRLVVPYDDIFVSGNDL